MNHQRVIPFARLEARQSILFAKPGDSNAMWDLSGKAFVEGFEVLEETFGSIHLNGAIAQLKRGEAVFVDTLQAMGSTQEAVIETVNELILKQGLRVSLLDARHSSIEITRDTIICLQAFHCLDVMLANRAA